MAKPLPTPIIRHLNFIGWYQIVGGCLGFLFVSRSVIFDQVDWNFLVVIFYTLFFLFFSYSIFAGVLCIGKKDSALTHTFINQALQVLHFNLYGYGLEYSAGCYFDLVFSLSDPGFPSFFLGLSNISMQFNGSTLYPQIAFNIIAIFFLYWAWHLRRRIEREKLINLM